MERDFSRTNYIMAGAFLCAALVVTVICTLLYGANVPKSTLLHERMASVPYKACETLVPLLLTDRHLTVKVRVNGHVFNRKENPLPLDPSSLARAAASCQPGSDNLLIVDETNP